MARLARSEVFDPDEVAIGHFYNRTTRRCFLMGPVGFGCGVLVQTREQFRAVVLQCGRSSGVRRFDAVSSNAAAIPSSPPRTGTSHGGRLTRRRLPLDREADETSRSRSRRARSGTNVKLTHFVSFGAVQSSPGATQIR